MRGPVIAIVVAGVVIVGLAAGYMIDIDQTEETKLPTVSLDVDGGNLPKFDAEVGDIDLTKETVTVTVPKVEMVEKDVSVPGISVTPPGDADGQPVTGTE